MAEAIDEVQSPAKGARFWLRPAAPEDAPAMVAIIRQAYEEYAGKLDPPSGAFKESEAKIRELLAREHGVLAGMGDAVAGCVFYHPDGVDTYFHRLAVLPAYRRLAIGRALVSYVEARAREIRSDHVRLGVRLAIPANLALYASLGYTVEGYGTHAGYIEPTFARMIKRVAEPEQRLVEVVPPDPDWPRRFRAEAVLLQLVFGDNLVAIHHVGSTSIPGLYAKPVIDIMPIVHDLDAVDANNELMQALGYRPRGESEIPGRRYFTKGENRRLYQVHAYTAGNPEVERHLKFRDFLSAHPAKARAYGELKLELARRFPHDIYGYMDGKDALIKAYLADALRWQTG
jgi:GrpB-like predicted nucleotidyltransferase (UPF0157 family)/ribosomal protein S18 acetylase RimI-like enzyme